MFGCTDAPEAISLAAGLKGKEDESHEGFAVIHFIT
jgi:hypothetical protein